MNKNVADKNVENNGGIRMKRLADIHSDKAVPNGAFAIYPGPRCPLALVTNVISGIKGACALIVGMAECTYYNRNISLALNKETQTNHTWSYSLTSNEVIFGCREGVMQALEQIDRDGAEAIFLVSACVPELIGEDFEGMAREANSRLKARVIHIHAAHFRCFSSVPAREEALASLHQLMEKQEVREKTVNLLGEGARWVGKSELVRLLRKQGIHINCSIPGNLTVEEIRKASSAALSIVVDMAALPLAQRMLESFGTPFVLFPHLLDVEEIRSAYREIGAHLQVDLEKEIEVLYAGAKKQMEIHVQKVKGKSFACGYLEIDPFICSAFLSSLGMNPVYLEIEYFFEKARQWSGKVLADGYNPYIGRTFTFNTTRQVLRDLFPDYFLGHAMQKQAKTGALPYVKCEGAGSLLGFEQPMHLLDALAAASQTTEQLKT